MKKWSYTVVMVMIFAVRSANTQTISAGLFGGYQSSNINFNITELGDEITLKTSNRSTLAWGGIIEMPFHQYLSIRLEPQYQKGGGRFSVDELIDESIPVSSIGFNTSYFEVPVLLKFAVGNTICPFMTVGVTMGYRLDANLETNLGGLALEFGMKDLTKSFRWGLTLGGGVQIPLGTSTMFVEGRYTQGMTDILSSGSLSVGIDSEVGELDIDEKDVTLKSEGFQIVTGIIIPLSFGPIDPAPDSSSSDE